MKSSTSFRSLLLMPVYLLAGCAGEPDIEILPGLDECHECHMTIDQPNQASGYVLTREFVTFDSPGCLLRSIESLPKSERPQLADIYFADYRDGTLHSAETAAFLLTTHIPTVMGSGALTFAGRDAAEDTREHGDEVVTDWVGYRTMRGTPDVVLDVQLGPDGLVPEIIEVNKDDLVQLNVVGRGLPNDLSFTVRGYPEAGEVVVHVGGTVEFRLLASRPGTGFPVVAQDGRSLGMMRVAGAHTADEEAN
jgi:hypothetical protein